MSYFEYVLRPHDYLVNDSTTAIQAFFRLRDGADFTQFVRSQNFSILQPERPDPELAVPTDANTWTGSVTLLSSLGFATAAATTVVASITSEADATAGSMTAAVTSSSSTAPPSSSSSSAAISTQTVVGLAVGLGLLGVLLVVGVVALLFWRQRRKGRREARDGAVAPAPSELDASALAVRELEKKGSVHRRGELDASEASAPKVGELDATPRVEQELDGRAIR